MQRVAEPVQEKHWLALRDEVIALSIEIQDPPDLDRFRRSDRIFIPKQERALLELRLQFVLHTRDADGIAFPARHEPLRPRPERDADLADDTRARFVFAQDEHLNA